MSHTRPARPRSPSQTRQHLAPHAADQDERSEDRYSTEMVAAGSFIRGTGRSIEQHRNGPADQPGNNKAMPAAGQAQRRMRAMIDRRRRAGRRDDGVLMKSITVPCQPKGRERPADSRGKADCPLDSALARTETYAYSFLR